MAIDQTPPAMTTDPAEVIENELPTYRAISPGAIVSLILGIASVLCFTDFWFLTVAVAAIVVGLLSLRKIRRLPEILTGGNYARAGIALALVFALSMITHEVASGILIDIDAGKFATMFTGVIKDQPVNVSLWYQQSPAYRKSKNPDEIADELKQAKGPAAVDMYREKTASVRAMKERLKGPGEQIRFAKVESRAVDGLTVYANALLELDGPGSTDFPEKEQFAMVQLMKGPEDGPHGWVVKDIRFPYKPASSLATVVKKVDDGHGHGH